MNLNEAGDGFIFGPHLGKGWEAGQFLNSRSIYFLPSRGFAFSWRVGDGANVLESRGGGGGGGGAPTARVRIRGGWGEKMGRLPKQVDNMGKDTLPTFFLGFLAELSAGASPPAERLKLYHASVPPDLGMD